jgi:cytochrome P450
MTISAKTAALTEAEARPQHQGPVVGDFMFAKELLRSPAVVQAARGADEIRRITPPEHLSVFFLDGEMHKKRRGQIARFFTPKAMKTSYRPVMEESTAKLIARLRKSGREQLDLLSFELACDVAAKIVGLTNSEPRAMALRIRNSFTTLKEIPKGHVVRFFFRLKKSLLQLNVLVRDVLPAIRARRKQREDDVLSLLIDEGYTTKSMFIECQTYASAGMMTTREFIVLACWQLLENPEVKERFIAADERGQYAILEEILRLDPVVTFVHRRADADATLEDGRTVKAGEYYTVDLRAANRDEAIVGADPENFDIDRAARQNMSSSWMIFGDGPHRCPGAQVALHEARVFLDSLMRLPGVRLANAPTPYWTGTTYELHGAFIECDRA